MISNENRIEKFTQPQRLHPAAIVFSLISTIKETIFGFGIGLILTIKESFFYFVIFASLFIVFLILFSLLSWWRFTFHIEDDELRVEQGVFVRKKRYISKHRIHKIDLTANVIHRLFKLVSLQIDTASNSGNAEVNLSAIRYSDAVALRKTLQKNKQFVDGMTDEEGAINPQKRITWRRLFIAGSTSGSAGIIVLAALTLFSQIEELIPRKVFNMAYNWLISTSIAFLVILIVFLAFLLWVFGIAGTMIRYGNFTIEKRKNELFIRRGLLETKELTIPYERIQAIGIEQSPIRQPFGFVRVFAVVAGGSFDKLESFPVLFPIMRKGDVASFIEQYIPDYDYSIYEELHRLPKRSLLFYVAKAFIFPILLLIAILFLMPSLYWLSLIALFFTLLLGYYQFKDLGYAINGKSFAFQKRSFQKVYIMTSKQRIQAFDKSQHKVQEINDLASIKLSLIGSEGLGTHYRLEHLANEEANDIAEWYSYRADKDRKSDVSELESST